MREAALRVSQRSRVTMGVAEFVRILGLTCSHGRTSHEVRYGLMRNAREAIAKRLSGW